MRILVLSPSVERPGGVSRSVRRIVRSLRDHGHSVAHVSPDDDLFPGDVRREAGEVRFGPRLRGAAHVDEAHREHAGVAEGAIDRDVAAPEVVLGFYATSAGRAAARVGERRGLPTVVAARGNDVDRDLSGVEEAAGFAREALTKATLVTAVSSEMVEKLRLYLGIEATFIHNAVDPAIFFPDPEAARTFAERVGLPRDRKVLGLFGELKAKRGLSLLRRLPRALLRTFEILIVGLVRAEARRDLPPGARWVPYLADDEALRGAYGACAAILQPSLHDGMPNVVLEAMACGRPVITSRAGGLADVVVDGETGFSCETPEAWASALAKIASGEAEAVGEAARARVPTPAIERAAVEVALQEAIRRYTDSRASR